MSVSDGLLVPIEYKTQVDKCIIKYKSFDGFLSKLNIAATDKLIPIWQDDMILPFTDNGEITVPTIFVASLAFGREKIMAWLMSYIVNVNSFFLGSNPEKKMTPAQMEDAASVLIQNYGNLFVSETPIIFSRIKGGRYGKAYGVVDGGMLCNCFTLYMEGRGEEQAQIHKRKEAERIKRREEEWAKQSRMSFEEFKKTVDYAELEMNGTADKLESFVNKFDFNIEDK